MKRIYQLVGAAAMLAFAAALPAYAEPVDPGQTSVNIGPTPSGPVVSQGTAGFGSPGIAAGASSDTFRPESAPIPSSGLTFTYSPVPDNTLVIPGGPPQASNGVVPKPGTGFQPACPPGQTGYYVYDSTGAFAGVLCVPTATPTATAPATVVGLAQQASSRQPWPRLAVSVNPAT
ncbi:MAG: hypothetical protein M3082_13395, partial [Candidatus Dormibacteraeota bacterium]|nr:hypothetical protein [Candidatus Dormibacteraeota bacterium]